jgi:RimJ/RimL family protein N-acetyltransferase
MEFFERPLSRAQAAQLIARVERGFDERGYGLWALELPGEMQMAGFVGLLPVDHDLPCAPAVEIGWRLARSAWGRGLASEAARRVVEFAFDELALEELVSMTSVANRRSRAVMERLGMRREEAEDFEHPRVSAGHPLAPHVLYRLASVDFEDPRSSRG